MAALSLAFGLAAASGAVSAQAPIAATAAEPLIVTIDLNRERQPGTYVVQRTSDGKLWLAVDDLSKLRLRRPAFATRTFDGAEHVPVDALPDARATLDARTLTLVLAVAASAFTDTDIAGRQARLRTPTRPQLGGFFNYSLFASHESDHTQTSAIVEAGAFSRLGVVVTGWLLGDSPDTSQSRDVRLETTWTLDFPDKLTTLRVGDTVSNPGRWGRSLRYGGVQFGTNFSVQPSFITQPLANASGAAALPSTVDVFVNNALVAQDRVPSGPFSIGNIPTVTGAGDVRLVVRDMFGQETVITMPFYGGVNLLRAGLDEYSIEGGTERLNFGEVSNDYGQAFAVGVWRRGITDEITADVRGEWSRASSAVGAGADFLVPRVGTASVALAVSRREDGATGTLVGVGIERQAVPFSFALRGQWTSPDFARVGDAVDVPSPWRQLIAAAGVQFGRGGNLSGTWVRQDFRDRDKVQVLSLNYSVPFLERATIGVFMSRAWGEGGSLSVGAGITVPFGLVDTASVVYNGVRKSATGNRDDVVATAQRALPIGEGFGYRVAVHSDDQAEAGAAYQGPYGTVGVDVGYAKGETGVRANLQGGFGFIGGHVFASRAIRDSFAIVRVADTPDVEITLDNQVAGRTGRDGTIVLPTLRPYDVNRIGLNAGTLPLELQVERLFDEAIPYFRSGVLVDMAVRRERAAVFKLRRDDGSVMPSGALVSIDGRTELFPVALDGETYVTGLDERTTRLKARWDGRTCAFAIAWPGGRDPLPDLGTVRCVGGMQ
ncbi:MAG TPA: fimbria/pilus outer membrane usher protein [Casimicrobiaceae bacterium]